MHAGPKTLFINSLRSGAFRKGVTHLCAEDSNGVEHYCALGVLTEAAMADGVEIEKRKAKSDMLAGAFLYNGMTSFVGPEVREWSGLSERQCIRLANLNDEGKSFNKIADYVEENL